MAKRVAVLGLPLCLFNVYLHTPEGSLRDGMTGEAVDVEAARPSICWSAKGVIRGSPGQVRGRVLARSSARNRAHALLWRPVRILPLLSLSLNTHPLAYKFADAISAEERTDAGGFYVRSV